MNFYQNIMKKTKKAMKKNSNNNIIAFNLVVIKTNKSNWYETITKNINIKRR